MPESHSRRLEDVSNLGVNGGVVAGATEVCTVTAIIVVVYESSIGELAGNKDGKPLVVDNVLVRGDGQLPSAIVQPLVFLIKSVQFFGFTVLLQLLSPVVMNSVPQNTHGQ